MTTGVVIKIDNEADREDWAHVLKGFKISEIYELPGLGHPFTNSIKLEHLVDLEKYHAADLVVIQPRFGHFVQGVSDLLAFEHPDEAIYVFGGTMTRLSHHDLEGVKPSAAVYIPAGDQFPATAGAIVLWDRLTKAPT